MPGVSTKLLQRTGNEMENVLLWVSLRIVTPKILMYSYSKPLGKTLYCFIVRIKLKFYTFFHCCSYNRPNSRVEIAKQSIMSLCIDYDSLQIMAEIYLLKSVRLLFNTPKNSVILKHYYKAIY